MRQHQTISVIDDCCDNLLLIQLLLESEGYQVNCAHSGVEGLKKVEDLNPSLIIVDLMMPDMSEIEVIRRLKNNHKLSSIATLLLTANAEFSTKDAQNVDLICHKPFDLNDFVAQVKFLLPQCDRTS